MNVFVDDEGEEAVAPGIQAWRDGVAAAGTLSRLHVLLGILDSCIKWEKSAEHAVSDGWVLSAFVDHTMVMVED